MPGAGVVPGASPRAIATGADADRGVRLLFQGFVVQEGVCTLALLFGLFNLIFGIWLVAQGIELRRTGKTMDSAFPEKQPA